MDRLEPHIESLIFVADTPIALDEIKASLELAFEIKLKVDDLRTSIDRLIEKYQKETFAIEIVEIAEGFQFLTKGAYHDTIAAFLKNRTKRRLSKSAMETLSIIAYKQPVSRGDMERIRGVSCDYSLQKLLEKELVSIIGRSDGPGRPLLYGTSDKFMNYFGLKNMGDLPKPKEFKIDSEHTIGEQAPIEETQTVESTKDFTEEE